MSMVTYRQRVVDFLQQRPDEVSYYGDTYAALLTIAEAIEAAVGRRL